MFLTGRNSSIVADVRAATKLVASPAQALLKHKLPWSTPKTGRSENSTPSSVATKLRELMRPIRRLHEFLDGRLSSADLAQPYPYLEGEASGAPRGETGSGETLALHPVNF